MDPTTLQMNSINSMRDYRPHSREVLSQWRTLTHHAGPNRVEIAINGGSLDIATVVAVARSMNSDDANTSANFCF